MAVDCRGNFSWCANNQNLDSTRIGQKGVGTEKNGMCVTMTPLGLLNAFSCNEKKFFICEVNKASFLYKWKQSYTEDPKM